MNTKITSKELVIELWLFVTVFSLISFFYMSNILLTCLLFSAWTVGILFWHTKRDMLLFSVGAIVGPLAEIMVIKFGVWSYSRPVVFGIPTWLPIAWGEATVFIYKVANMIFYKFGKNGIND
jgi:hypothetical protein